VTWTDAEYGVFTAADMAIPANFPGLSLLPAPVRRSRRSGRRPCR